MKMQNIWTSEKWQKMKKPDEQFVKDIKKYAKYVAADYNKLGLATYLKITPAGTIDLSLGADKTALGFLEIHRIFRLEAKRDLSSVCSPLIQKHLITIAGIYLLLNKYGYIKDYMPNYIMLDEIGDETIQDAQAELMNLQLI